MFAGPPPKAGAGGAAARGPRGRGVLGFVEITRVMVCVMVWFAIWLRSTVFGSLRMAWVIVPEMI